jgi:hypothetical protein
MNKNRIIISFLTLLLIGFGCKDKAPISTNILPKETMVSIIVEMELLQATFKVEQQEKKFNLEKTSSFIFENHYTTKKQFDESILYYSKYPQEMESIYNEVITVLSQKQVVLN